MVVPTTMLAGNFPHRGAVFRAARAYFGRVHFYINVALVKTGSDYVLIDAGSGGTWEPTAGKLADSLEAAGVAPERIGTVVIYACAPRSPLGPGGDLNDSPRFPRAR